MKTLLILRHAKSSWKDESLPDHDRPLKGRGKRDAPKMGNLIRKQDLLPDLILSSTAKRARNTANLVMDACGYGGETKLVRRLYHGAPSDYIEVLKSVNNTHQRVMVVGHNPGLEMLLEQLTGEDEFLPTAALAEVNLPIKHWGALDEEIEGDLVNLWVPRELP